jgi:hypothetical protein
MTTHTRPGTVPVLSHRAGEAWGLWPEGLRGLICLKLDHRGGSIGKWYRTFKKQRLVGDG